MHFLFFLTFQRLFFFPFKYSQSDQTLNMILWGRGSGQGGIFSISGFITGLIFKFQTWQLHASPSGVLKDNQRAFWTPDGPGGRNFFLEE